LSGQIHHITPKKVLCGILGQSPITLKRGIFDMSNRDGKKKKEIFFEEEDWEIIEEKANKCNLDTTKYIRKIALEGNVIIYDLKDASNLVYEINKIGVNINQLAKKANEIKSIFEHDIKSMKREYDELCLMLNQFLLNLPSIKV